jgi:hypothetical protein
MTDENRRDLDAVNIKAPEPQKANDGSSDSKNDAERQEGPETDPPETDPLGFNNARRFLENDAQPGRYSAQQIFALTKDLFHADETDIINAAEALGFLEKPDTIHIPDERSKVLAALAVIPSDIDYTSWYEIGSALCHVFGSEKGFEIWDSWSSTSQTKYVPREMRDKWRKCCEILAHAFTARTVYHYADEADPSWRQQYEESVFSTLADSYPDRSNGRAHEQDAGASTNDGRSSKHDGPNKKHEGHSSEQLIKLDDFVAYLPQADYIYLPTGNHWPAASVNTRVNPLKIGKKTLTASDWLRKNRAVSQLSWDPRKPQLVHDQLVSSGGWFEKIGDTVLNLYQPPKIVFGPSDEAATKPWLDLLRKVFPKDWQHIICFLAHRVQNPGEKINHCLFLGGQQGIGKDTILQPLRHAVGPDNFKDTSPKRIVGRFNSYVQSVVVLISELNDLGEVSRYDFYEAMKTLSAAPPDTLDCERKHIDCYPVVNVCSPIITSNYKTGGLYLPADDRRHYVAWSELAKEDFTPEFWNKIWHWYLHEDGLQIVANYLHDYDLSNFNAKAPPAKTEAFHAIVASNCSPEEGELAHAIDLLDNPAALTIAMVANATPSHDFALWLEDRRNSRVIPHRLEGIGYTCILCPDNKQGLWGYHLKRAQGADIVKTRHRTAIFGRRELSERERHAAAKALLKKLEKDSTPPRQ